MVGTLLRGIIVWILFPAYTCQPNLICPASAQLGSTVNLACSHQNPSIVSFIRPGAGAGTAGTCFDSDCRNSSERFQLTYINSSQVTLTVSSVQFTDEGVWTCTAGGDSGTCTLRVYKLPTCDINSNINTDNLSLGQEVTLSVNVSNYYCSSNVTWNLVVGSTSVDIPDTTTVTPGVLRSSVVTHSLTASPSVNGSVVLMFVCNLSTFEVNCKGKKSIKLIDPPRCNISTEEEAKENEKLILYAEIEDYPCPTNISYFLKIGTATVTEFTRNQTGNSNEYIARFRVEPEYFDEPLELNYSCNGVSSSTPTFGLQKLESKNEENRDSHVFIIAGVAAGVVLVIIVVGIVIFICMKPERRLCPKVAASKEVEYSDVLDSVPGRKTSLKVTNTDTYTEVSDVNGSLRKDNFETNRPRSEIQMVPNVAYESLEEFNKQRKQNSSANKTEPVYEYSQVNKLRRNEDGKSEFVISSQV